RAEASNAIPLRSRSSFTTASGGIRGYRSIRLSTRCVRLPLSALTSSKYLQARPRGECLWRARRVTHGPCRPELTRRRALPAEAQGRGRGTERAPKKQSAHGVNMDSLVLSMVSPLLGVL